MADTLSYIARLIQEWTNANTRYHVHRTERQCLNGPFARAGTSLQFGVCWNRRQSKAPTAQLILVADRARDCKTGAGKVEYRASEVVGYAAARLPACYAVAHRVFQELSTRLPSFQPQTMLDFGAGPGTAIWAATDVSPLDPSPLTP